jgi:hypothetical protein
VHGDPDGSFGCQQRIAGAQALRVRPLPGTDRYIETTRGVGHTRYEAEVRSTQRRTRIFLEEQVEGLLPLATLRGVARPFSWRCFGQIHSFLASMGVLQVGPL